MRILLLGALALSAPGPVEPASRTWTFDAEPTGAIPRGFAPAVGAWSVVTSDGGKALAQSASSGDATFNVILADDTALKDVDLSVKIQAVAGDLDRGGGLLWRARDARNYYVARYNHLEDNLRVYKVVDGVRSPPMANADIPHHDGWTTLRVVMTGDRITVGLDGQDRFVVRDATFAGPGKIGLWSKADARSLFDDLSVSGR